jgi:hypothetical protein
MKALAVVLLFAFVFAMKWDFNFKTACLLVCAPLAAVAIAVSGGKERP